jgi:hypothetical protein
MNAKPIVEKIARALKRINLEAIVVGNAGAALQGAPVSTEDLDFLIRQTPGNAKKIALLAKKLDGTASRPHYPLSSFWRITTRGSSPVQIDLCVNAHGIKSFESLRSRSTLVAVGKEAVAVASLRDIIKSKRAAGRPKDLAVLPVLEATLHEKNAKKTRKA